jgi:formate-dependent nitrite reductase cytochrome c552 subunit
MLAVLLPLAAIAMLALAGEGEVKKPSGRAPQAATSAGAVSPTPGTAPAPKTANPAKRSPANNGACLVCHANYEDEPMAACHAKEGTGCMDCHGQSWAHRNDEGNVTPPDVLYPAAKIDVACKKCHEDHNAPAVKVIARWQERCPAKTKPSQVVCTDCHGEHRLKFRTVRWDKETRKLLDPGDAGGKP